MRPGASVTLGDLCELVSRQVDPAAMPQATYLGLEHLAPGRLLPIAHGSARDVTSAKTAYEAGDVLVGKLRPYLDKAVLAEEPGICTTELLALRPKEGVDPRFLACVVHRPDFVAHAMTGVAGAQHPRTSWAHLSRFELEPVPIERQRAIADLLWRVHDLLLAVESTHGGALSLKKAAAAAIFSRGLANEPGESSPSGSAPAGWEVVPLGELGKIGNGSTPKKSTSEFWDGGTFPWLTSAKIYDRTIVAADQFVTPIALRDCHLPVLAPGAVLVAITGQGKTLGNCAELQVEATISQHLAYVQTDTERILPTFLRYYLETQYEYLRRVASAGGSTKGALTCSFLRTLPVPVPSLSEQRDVVALIGTLERTIQMRGEKQQQLERLLRALLEPATSGGIDVEKVVGQAGIGLEAAA